MCQIFTKSNRMNERKVKSGAGDGNRTHAFSLGSWGSTIELHPLGDEGKESFFENRLSTSGAGDGNRTHAFSLGSWGSTIELHPLGERCAYCNENFILSQQVIKNDGNFFKW